MRNNDYRDGAERCAMHRSIAYTGDMDSFGENKRIVKLRSALSVFRPTVASLGYALFLAVNATGVWGGVFPFLPLDFQTPQILFWFFLMQSVTFFASFLASGLGAYYLPGPTKRLSVVLAGTPYLIGWCCLIAAIYLDDAALPLVMAGGAFLGLGSAGFYMLWQRLFASRDADKGNRDLMAGTAYAALLYFALYLLPQAITAFLIPLVFMPLFALAIVVESRTVDRDQPMFQDVPREHPHVYRHVARDYWRSALCVGALGFCAGIMRSLALGEIQMGTLVNVLSMAGSLAMAVTMLSLWRFKSLRVNVAGAYRFFFPFAITALLLLPFLPTAYGRWLAAILYALYSAAIMLMMIQCAQASRDRGINPVFIYGLFGSVVYALHDLGFFGGLLVERINVAGIPSLAVVAMVALYLLGLIHFVGLGGMRRALGLDERDTSIELVALMPHDADQREAACGRGGVDRKAPVPSHAAGGTAAPAPSEPSAAPASPAITERDPGTRAASHAPDAPGDDRSGPVAAEARAAKTRLAEGSDDLLALQVEQVRQRYRLSARETEVMELIARGYTVARIAEMLVVSENTIRTHSKRIYAKLDVHKRQELRDLIDSFDPRELG